MSELFDVIRAYARGSYLVQRVGVSSEYAQELIAKRAKSYAASNGLDYAVPHTPRNVLGRTPCQESRMEIRKQVYAMAEPPAWAREALKIRTTSGR